MVRLNYRTAIVAHDLFMAFFAWQLSWWARFNFSFPFPDQNLSFYTLPIVLITQSIIFWRFNLYRGVWRFASLPDLWNILRASILGSLCITLVLFIFFRLEGVPRSIFILYPLFLSFLLGGPRLGYRIWKDRSFFANANLNPIPVIVIGAGRAGEMLVRDMLRHGDYHPLGLVDDNSRIKDSEIRGIRVLGEVKHLKTYVKKLAPQMLFIAIPSASDIEMQRIVSICEEMDIPVKTLPKLTEMVSGTPSLDNLRELSIEDLLGREKIELDWDKVQEDILDKTIFVSGGGGSIGSELCNQIAKLAPAKLIIYERSEFNLYKIQNALSEHHSSVNIIGVLGDICDKEKTEHTIYKYRPDVIYHAAAYKHVPILEEQCREAVRNNVIGTLNLANAAIKYESKKFVFISTDKAVNSENILGHTKRIAEMICEIKNTNSITRFITVRFGNVLGSDGSVLPLFQEQLRNGGPLTVTHPEVTRFFMTIMEASQLIMQAGVMGVGGEIFVLDMGNPVKISFLAEQLIKLSGPRIANSIEIEYIGLRPGEKLTEELFHTDEHRDMTTHDKILLAKHPTIDETYINDVIQSLEHAVAKFDEEHLATLLKDAINQIQYSSDKKDNVISIT